VAPSLAWNEEEANPLKPVMKPIFEDGIATPLRVTKHANIQRAGIHFPSDAVLEDPEIQS
jgi:hypothetical protein